MAAPRLQLAPDYRSFPNVARRNWLQESFEVPLMVRILGLPCEARVLEVGCGRGVALPPLARLLRPRYLVGVDVDARLLIAAAERHRVPDRLGPVVPARTGTLLAFTLAVLLLGLVVCAWNRAAAAPDPGAGGIGFRPGTC